MCHLTAELGEEFSIQEQGCPEPPVASELGTSEKATVNLILFTLIYLILLQVYTFPSKYFRIDAFIKII